MIKSKQSAIQTVTITPEAQVRTSLATVNFSNIEQGDQFVISYQCKASLALGYDQVGFYLTTSEDLTIGIVDNSAYMPVLLAYDTLENDGDCVRAATIILEVFSAPESGNGSVFLQVATKCGVATCYEYQNCISVVHCGGE